MKGACAMLRESRSRERELTKLVDGATSKNDVLARTIVKWKEKETKQWR